MTVYLARHGETVWNAEGRYQGRLDAPLTDTGRAHARATARTTRGRGVERLLCSPLGRARATARVVERTLDLAAEIDDDLAESDIGRWEGLTRAEVEAAFPGELAQREEDRLHYRPPGGESLADMLVRARAAAGCSSPPTASSSSTAGVIRRSISISWSSSTETRRSSTATACSKVPSPTSCSSGSR